MKAHSALGIPAAFQMIVTNGGAGSIAFVEFGQVAKNTPIQQINGGDDSPAAIARFILAATAKWGYAEIDPPAQASTLAELADKVRASYPES